MPVAIAPPLLLYLACVAGAVGLLLMMPQAARPVRALGAVIGAATLGATWILLAQEQSPYRFGLETEAVPFYYVFSAIAIVAAVCVIASRKPVYAALWFVMVVLASAGLFLTLSAEFMAVAMVIIYGGAILVTYLFVIMLAAYSGDPQRAENLPLYDRAWRDPVGAVCCGFLLLAVLLTVAFENRSPSLEHRAAEDAAVIAQWLPHRAHRRLIESIDPSLDPGSMQRQSAAVTGGNIDVLSNTERVGLDLFQAHPLGIELAGVILTVSLVGAVVIARTQVNPQKPAQPGGGGHG